MATLYDDPIDYDSADRMYDGADFTSISINGIHGQTFNSGTEELIVVWDKHPVIYNSTTGAWQFQPVTITTNTNVYFETFLDHVFMVNGTDANYSYNATTWSTTTNLTDSPIAQYVKAHQARLYLYNIKIGALATKPSWCWYSDYPKNNALKYGLEYGTDLAQTASSAVVTSAGSAFKVNNIKIGDPLFILSGNNAGEYRVRTVDSATQLTLTETLGSNATNSSFFVGGNYFEVQTDDGDIGNGLAETSNELFLFKKNSLWRLNAATNELRKVKTAPGTTSPRSIVESGGYVYWYHPSGIYRTQGAEEELISRSIQDVIEGVTSTNQSLVCGWRNEIKHTISFYLGDVTLRDDRVIEKCVAVFDETAETMSLRSMDTVVKVATNWLKSNVPTVYAGDTIRTVYQLETGNNYDGLAIPFELELYPYYPQGTEGIVTFDRLRSYVENGEDIQLYYRLYGKPTKKAQVWINDEDWKPLQGSQGGAVAEWNFPPGARGAGVQIKVVESSTDKTFLLEKLVIYYSDVANR